LSERDDFIEKYRKALPEIQKVYGPNYNPLKICENGEPQGAVPGDEWGIEAVLKLRHKLGLKVRGRIR
jgi:hypothetical protein